VIVLGLRDGVPFLNDLTASRAVPLDTWGTLVASWGDGTGALSALAGGASEDLGSLTPLSPGQRSKIFLLGAKPAPGAGFTSHFSGRIERPALLSGVIAWVSQKMLTQTLRTLERDGLVARTVTPAVPVRVDYALTPLGEGLMPAVNAVKAWAEQHIEEIEASRAAYDGRAAAR
jgi:DNA-binding HxlR family transcriptional regulator